VTRVVLAASAAYGALLVLIILPPDSTVNEKDFGQEYLLARAMFGPLVAGLAGLLLAVNHFHLHFSRILVFAGIMDALFATVALWLLYRGLRDGRAIDGELSGDVLIVVGGFGRDQGTIGEARRRPRSAAGPCVRRYPRLTSSHGALFSLSEHLRVRRT